MLCQSTQNQARWIWTSLRTARTHELTIGEESITDFLVLQLKKESKGTYYVKSFTRPKEKITGADWELWLTSPSGHWLGLRIQAKVISADGKKYNHLHYKRKDGIYQCDQLLADAKRHGAHALYCLYSYWKSGDAGKLAWPCVTFKKNSRLFGASWLSVHAVQTLKRHCENSLKVVAKSLHPFHCLFCCHGHGSGDLPSRAGNFLSALGYATDPSSLFQRAPPYYVSQLIESESAHAPSIGSDLVDLNDANLYRVTIVREIAQQDSKQHGGQAPIG